MTVFDVMLDDVAVQEPVHLSLGTDIAFAGFLEIQVEAFQMYESVRAEKRAKVLPTAKDELMMGQAYRRASRLTGDEKRANFYKGLQTMNDHSMEMFGEPIPTEHLKIADNLVTTFLQKMYGKEFDRNLARLLRLYEMDMFRTCGFISMGRRTGKTYLISMIVAIYLYTQPAAKINVYSIGRRASSMFAAMVISHLLTLVGPGIEFRKKDQETITIVNMYGENSGYGLSTLNSYPDSDDVCINFSFLFF